MNEYARYGREACAAASAKVHRQRARVRSAMQDKAAVDRAVARLVTKLDLRPSEALEELERTAQQGGLSLPDAGQRVGAPPPRDLTPPEVPDWVQNVLETHDHSALYCQPVTDSVGRVIDFWVQAANTGCRTFDGRSGEEMIGKCLLEISPAISGIGLLDDFIAAYETGVPFLKKAIEYVEIVGERTWPALMNVRATRVQDSLMLSWRMMDEHHVLFAGWDRAQRLAGLGWAEWDLASQQVTWTPLMYEIFGRDREDEPLALEDLPAMAVPEDLPVLGDVIDSLLESREPTEAEFRIQHRHGIRQLRIVGEPLLDGDGIPLKVRLLVQDLTTVRHRERATVKAHEQAAREQERAQEERRITTHLQNTLLPPNRRLMHLPGLAVGVHYQPADQLAHLGGDFFNAQLIHDGEVLLSVGDAMGHGLVAAGIMLQMRSALAGLAYTGAAPNQLAAWLNEVTTHTDEEVTTTGTAVIGHFEAADRTFAWTNAGHCSPLLVREGHAEPLEGPSGPLLGGIETDYDLITTPLQPGDVLLLYTDGLVERRGQHLDTGIQRLIQVAQACPLNDPEELLDCVLQRLGPIPGDDDICIVAARVL